jgi:hypothetical protein
MSMRSGVSRAPLLVIVLVLALMLDLLGRS